MKFKSGQKVVCTAKGQWFKELNLSNISLWKRLQILFKGNRCLGPVYNEVVTVDNISQNPGHVSLVEYPGLGQYDDRYFEPLVTNEVLEEELSEILSNQ